MSVPPFEQFLRPVLALAARETITRVSVAEAMSSHFGLSEEDQWARIPSGGSTFLRNRTGWAMTFLTKASLIEKVAPKQYRATAQGREFLATHPEAISSRDLAAVAGWREAWRPTDGTDDAPDAVDDGEGASSEAIEARVRAKVERAIPNEASRRAILEFLAYAVENADEERSDAWSLHETRRGLELMVGRLVAFRIERDVIRVSVVGPISVETRASLGARGEDEEAWRWVEGGLYLSLPVERAAANLDLLKDPLASFVDASMARVRRGVSLEDHVPESIIYLSKEVGRELPQPAARPESSGDEDADDEDSEPEASREPKVRGRAPIFEPGQRAIASLIEDIDPARGTIALPDLQRPFVWEDRQVRDLLDSLFIGYPVGTLVLWHTADGKDARAVGDPRSALRTTTLVIDGQQRLTSLYAVMRGKPVTDKDGETRQISIAFRPRDGRFDVADAAIIKDPEYLSDVGELWRGARTTMQVRKDLLRGLSEKGRVVDDAYEEAVEHNLARAQAIKDYRLPTVEIRRTDSAVEASEEDVADIFVRINNQGSRLGQADFVLTLLSVFHGTLRDRIEIEAPRMSQGAVVSVDTQQVLRAACAVGFGRARMSAIYRYLRGVDPVTKDADPIRRRERLDALDQAADECLDSTRWRDYLLRVTRAGFVSSSLVSSPNAVVNAYAFYVRGRRVGVPKPTLDQAISRWLFGTLLTARYSSSAETKFEEDLARVPVDSVGGPEAFIEALDAILADTLTGDYWLRTLPAQLETQLGRAPAALAFRAAQVVLGARALFSDQLLQNVLAPSPAATRAASEMHHLFPRAWLRQCGIEDRRRVNQVANVADIGWHENSSAGKDRPSSYVGRLRQAHGISDDHWGRMCAEHALPPGWEAMDYEAFLSARRPRMAEVIRIAYRTLGGESDAPPLTPPWFLPGAEVVWQRIGDTERALRGVVREVYLERFGEAAGSKVESALGERERETLTRALRSRPAGADPLSVVDYLYFGQLPGLLFKSDVWPAVSQRFSQAGAKEKLQTAVTLISPVRNEIAHVREVAADRLQRANVACLDVLQMIEAKGASPRAD
jgi:hypothetical protein